MQTTLHLSSKNFRPLPKTLKLRGVCFEQQSLRPLLTVAVVSVLEGRRVARKELFGGTEKLKKLFVRKKWPVRPGLQISHQLNFVRTYGGRYGARMVAEARMVAATKVTLSKERA